MLSETIATRLQKDINRIAKEHDLKSIYLKEIVWYRARGKNNCEISHHTGFDRNTVNKYIMEMRGMNKDEILILTMAVCILNMDYKHLDHLKKIFIKETA
jgi:hypothetical protein